MTLFYRMLTVSESLRAQGRSILGFLEGSILAYLKEIRSPSLLPQGGTCSSQPA